MKIKHLIHLIMAAYISLLGQLALAQTMDIPDPVITKEIQTSIAADSSLSGTTISISTVNGIVDLSGNVDSNAQASTAAEIAQSTKGVKDVNTNNLTIKSSEQPMVDSLITAKIKGKFIQEDLFGKRDISSMSISVETNDGIVTLSGNAENQAQINNAIKIAKSVNGVKDVKSSIKIVAKTINK